MYLWRELKLPVTPSAHLLEEPILNQLRSVEGDIADKIEDHIERSYQVGKHLERRYQCVAEFAQSQTSRIKLQD